MIRSPSAYPPNCLQSTGLAKDLRNAAPARIQVKWGRSECSW